MKSVTVTLFILPGTVSVTVSALRHGFGSENMPNPFINYLWGTYMVLDCEYLITKSGTYSPTVCKWTLVRPFFNP